LIERPADYGVAVNEDASGVHVVDCGVRAPGGLSAGRTLAQVCLADLAEVTLVAGRADVWPGPAVCVAVDQAVRACLASQYAGWRISGNNYFGMGSGPMRAAYGQEALFDTIGQREQPQRTVGVLESSALPPSDVCRDLAERCRVAPGNLTLLVARTASIAGTMQVVARSVETALHKLHELHFDLQRIRGSFGAAPLPPVAADDLQAIGRTNDAILYGGDVVLWVEEDDERLAEFGARTPSCASPACGAPFLEIFRRANHDFYAIDPLLFSPARVTFINLSSGRQQTFGELRPDILQQSFT
jgi:methenyltetrahydromethanopterin cyclohydrolase